MAGRGSAIGMSATAGLGYGTSAGGVSGDVQGGSLYGKASSGLQGMRTHHWLWVLVAIEIAALVFMRMSFRRYHGG